MLKVISERTKGLLTMVANQFTQNKINWLATVITVAIQFAKNELNWLATVVKGLLTTVANQFTKNKINWLATIFNRISALLEDLWQFFQNQINIGKISKSFIIHSFFYLNYFYIL